MMHPYIQEAMVRDRVAELRVSGSRRRTGAGIRIGVSRHSRERVGWTLITIGLRLVNGQGGRLSARSAG
jgi:hypothetical protein